MLKWITFAPLIGALLCGFLGKRLGEKFVSLVACGSIAVSTVLTFVAFFTKLLPLPEGKRQITEYFFTWIEVGTFRADFAYLLDPLSGIYLLFITGVGLLIHIYATGYMRGDEGYYRFFAYLNLFMFMMLTLVLGDNLLLLFVGWEGVGLCSYLLIGYYIERKEAGDAAKKAFIVNRIGDFGYSIGVMVAFTTFTSISFVDKEIGGKVIPSLLSQAAGQAVEGVGIFGVMTAIALLLFVGACGKSAQVPLFVWLPDAMAGPTPVSALIHAATMVTAGVYLTARCSAVFTKSQTAMLIVAVIVQMSRIGVHVVVARSLGLHIPIAYFLLFVPLLAVIVSLPISLNGIGVREGAGMVLFGLVGVEGSRAFSLQFTTYLVAVAVSLLGAFVVLGRLLRQGLRSRDPGRTS